MGTTTALCTHFLLVNILLQKQNYIYIILTNNLLIRVIFRGYEPKLDHVFCHTKYVLIKSNSLPIHVTTETNFLQNTVHISQEIINNSARITHTHNVLHYTPTIIL
jgi:hypothetical protein